MEEQVVIGITVTEYIRVTVQPVHTLYSIRQSLRGHVKGLKPGNGRKPVSDCAHSIEFSEVRIAHQTINVECERRFRVGSRTLTTSRPQHLDCCRAACHLLGRPKVEPDR